MQQMFNGPRRKDFKKIEICNNRKCYEVFYNKKGSFVVNGFSSYLFGTDGSCKNWKTGRELSIDPSELKYILVDDTGKRTTFRINSVINQLLELL